MCSLVMDFCESPNTFSRFHDPFFRGATAGISTAISCSALGSLGIYSAERETIQDLLIFFSEAAIGVFGSINEEVSDLDLVINSIFFNTIILLINTLIFNNLITNLQLAKAYVSVITFYLSAKIIYLLTEIF
jgi:hypothetical protein